MPTFWKSDLFEIKKDRKTGINKISDKKKKRIKENGTEKELFERVWSSRVHLCSVCGKNIIDAKPECFAHILSKGRYPNLRYLEKNIDLVCSIECHHALDASNKGNDIQILKNLGVMK